MSDTTALVDLAPVPARGAPARAAGGARPLEGVILSARSFAAQPAVAKSLPALAFLALAGIALMVWMAFSAAPSRTLFAGLADAEKAAVVETLKAGGIAHEIDSATGAVTVPEDAYHDAKMLLASKGLPQSGPNGDEMISSLPLGSSRAVEGERIRGAKETDLARTIEAIDAVQAARVHLAVEAPSVFIRDRSQPAASVMLTLAQGRTLGEQQIQAIVHLVASSVPGLAPEGVSVVDQNGRLLSREGAGGPNAASERQLAVQAAIEERHLQSLSSLLTPILGAGNFSAEVHADVDFSEVQATRESYPENGRALRSEEGSMIADGGGEAAAGGIPGALANDPPAATEVAAAPEGTMVPPVPGAPGAPGAGRRTENYNRDFALGREVSVTRQHSGNVKRLSVAVALRNADGAPRSKEELAQLEQLVKGAIGFNAQRGDMVAISARKFAPVEATAPAWWEASWVGSLARNLAALAAVALLVFGLGRPMLKKLTAHLAQRSEAARNGRARVGGEMAAAIADQARNDPDSRVTLEMIEATRDYEARAALIRNFVRQDPARAALVVRDLIRADQNDGAVKHG